MSTLNCIAEPGYRIHALQASYRLSQGALTIRALPVSATGVHETAMISLPLEKDAYTGLGRAKATPVTAEWLFPPQEMPPAGLDNIVTFGRQVLEEDAAVCELNQRGLHSQRHVSGVLMPEEYDLHRFHRWVRAQHETL